ncbi:MAG: hypothetical protein WC655_23195 [Candidatus Hydrogenedentales bacterium]|jgi:hypothetical protein
MKAWAWNSHFLLALLLTAVAGLAVAGQDAKLGFQPAIRIPFARLQANPERFEKRVVTAVAFLAIDRGVLKAYPSRDAFVFDDQSSAVSLRGEFKTLQKWAKLNRSYVLITGKFHRIEHDGREFALGELSEFRIITQIDGARRLKDPDNALLLRGE